MVLSDFNDMCSFLNCGLNKIQVKEVFELIDESKKGHINSYELNSVFEESLKVGDKPE
jgi:Ca2+-binding EF-hand superfamily protein